MEEYGYPLLGGGPLGYEAALLTAQAEASALLRELTPDERLTNCFLLLSDYQNAKLLLKASLTGAQVKESLSACGTIPPEVMRRAIEEGETYRLPQDMAETIKKLRAKLNVNPDPFEIDAALDRAWIEEAMKRSAGSARAQRYFGDLVDLTNLRSALRAQRAGLDKARTARQMLPLGSVDAGAIVDRMQDGERLLRLYEKKDYYAALRRAFESCAQTGDLTALERMQDDHLLALYREKRWENNAVEPLIGYYLGKTREISMLRLIMAGKINGFSTEKLKERLRALYV
jgi:V/A-type H+-transporting ATPase subunit C